MTPYERDQLVTGWMVAYVTAKVFYDQQRMPMEYRALEEINYRGYARALRLVLLDVLRERVGC